MNGETRRTLLALNEIGWAVALSPEPAPLPSPIVARYSWVRPDVLDAVAHIQKAVSGDDKAWILSAPDYSGTSGAAFAWNEWEVMSLATAGDDQKWRQQIHDFWEAHFPVLLSVKSGYAYFAIERSTDSIVAAEEPEFENPDRIASSFEDLLRLIARRSPAIERWA
jgi:hypothetical protein